MTDLLKLQLQNFENDLVHLGKSLVFLGAEIREYTQYPCETVDLQNIKNMYDFHLRLYKKTLQNIVYTKSRLKYSTTN